MPYFAANVRGGANAKIDAVVTACIEASYSIFQRVHQPRQMGLPSRVIRPNPEVNRRPSGTHPEAMRRGANSQLTPALSIA